MIRHFKNFIPSLNKTYPSCFKFIENNHKSFGITLINHASIGTSNFKARIELQNQNRNRIFDKWIGECQDLLLLLQVSNQQKGRGNEMEKRGMSINPEESMTSMISDLLSINEFKAACSIYLLIIKNQSDNSFDLDQSFALYIIDEMLRFDEGVLMPDALDFVMKVLSVRGSIDPLIWDHLVVKAEDFYDDVALDTLMKHIPNSPDDEKLEEWIADIYARKQRWDRVRELMMRLPSRSAALYQILVEMWLQPAPIDLNRQFIDQIDDEKWEGIRYDEARNQLLILKKIGLLEMDRAAFGEALEAIMKKQAFPETFLSFLEKLVGLDQE